MAIVVTKTTVIDRYRLTEKLKHTHSPCEGADDAVLLGDISGEDFGWLFWEESCKVQLFLRVHNVVEVFNGLVVSVHKVRYNCKQTIIPLLFFLQI